MDRRLAESRKQEHDWAERWGGELSPGSGNGDKFNADVRTDIHLIELKYTHAASFTLKLGYLRKIAQQALLDGRDSVFGIELTQAAWPEPPSGDAGYVVLPEWDYLVKLERLAEQDKEIDKLYAELALRGQGT